MKNKLFVTLLFLFGLCLSAISQQVAQYTTYGISDGLPSNEVYDVEEDTLGYLWFATDRGVAKFDGKKFETFTSQDGLVNDCILWIHRDNTGRLWFTGLNGKMSYLQNDRFLDYKGNELIDSLNGSSKHNFGIGGHHEGKLYLFDKQPFYPSDEYKDLAEFMVLDTLGNLLERNLPTYTDAGRDLQCLFTEDGAIVMQYSYVSFYPYESELHLKSREKRRKAFFEEYHSLFDFLALVKKQSNGRITLGGIQSVTRKYNEYYICTEIGLAVWENKVGKDDTFTWLVENVNAARVLFDREENLWLTTINNGVIKIANKNVRRGDIFPGENADHPISMGSLGDNLIVVTRKYKVYAINRDAVLKFEENLYINWLPEEIQEIGLTGEYIDQNGVKVIDDSSRKNEIIFGPDRLKWSVGYHTLNNRKVIIPNKRIFALTFDEEHLGVATEDGFYQFMIDAKQNGSLHEVDTIYLKGKRISSARKSDKRIVLAVMGEGLRILQEGTIETISHPLLDKQMIQCLYIEGDSILWAGLNNGLVKATLNYQDGQFDITDAKKFTMQDGLISDFIIFIEKHKEKFWIATPKGLMFFDPGDLEKTSTPPLIYLDEFKSNNKDSSLNLRSPAELSSDQNNIRVRLRSVSNQRPTDFPFYQYTLFKNNRIIETGEQDDESMSFSDLTHGMYAVKVEGRNKAGEVSDPIILSWHINPHWTDTWWFSLSILALIVAILTMYFRRRERLLLEQKQLNFRMKELELRFLRNQMNPHFIYNVLNSIQMYIYRNEANKAGRYLKQFANLIRSFFEQSKLEFIELSEESEFLNRYVSLEKLRLRDQFDFSIRIDEAINPKTVLVPALILQPIVENAIKHGVVKDISKGYIEIDISLYSDQKYVRVTVENSGPIYDRTRQKKHLNSDEIHGMDILEERMNLLKTNFDFTLTSMAITSPIDVEKNKGCRIELVLPIKAII